MAHVRIVYGTTGGNTQLVCQYIAQELGNRKHKVSLERCEQADPQNLSKCDCLILASPTYGHGLLERNFATFFLKIQNLNLKGTKSTVIGLGDPKYDLDYLIESVNILKEYLQSHGAEIIIEPLRIAKSPLPYLEKGVTMWIDKLNKQLA